MYENVTVRDGNSDMIRLQRAFIRLFTDNGGVSLTLRLESTRQAPAQSSASKISPKSNQKFRSLLRSSFAGVEYSDVCSRLHPAQ
jgi:hypothetical protein